MTITRYYDSHSGGKACRVHAHSSSIMQANAAQISIVRYLDQIRTE